MSVIEAVYKPSNEDREFLSERTAIHLRFVQELEYKVRKRKVSLS